MTDTKTLTIHDKFKDNFFKSSDMEDLYKNYPNPWGKERKILRVDYNKRFEHMVNSVVRYTGFCENIAELGCGEGYFSDYVFRKNYCINVNGFDISSTAVERARSCFGFKNAERCLNYYQYDAAHDDPPVCDNNEYDCIVYADFLYYIEDRSGKKNAIRFADSCLKDDGFVVVVDRSRRYINTARLFCPFGYELLEDNYTNEGNGNGYRLAVFKKGLNTK